jgi:hypothetical protein
VTLRRACAPIVALALALAAGGCGGGSPSLSARQLRTRASNACAVATRRLNLIPTPQVPSQGAGFVRRGVAALKPEVAALAALHPEGEMGVDFRRAQTATEQELKALQSTITGLKAGNDPIVAIKTLQAQLAPLEKQASAAWRALKIPACAGT